MASWCGVHFPVVAVAVVASAWGCAAAAGPASLAIPVANGAPSSWDTCETIDGDCPDNCSAAGFNGTLGFVARLDISPTHPDIQAVAVRAEDYIVSQGAVESTDSPALGLHTSLFYFCCHTAGEVAGIKSALHGMQWDAFTVHYDSFACNLDHNNETIYLHGLPTNQTALWALAVNMEATVRAAGLPVNHPRKSLFHMTLARVNRSYPVDAVVGSFLANHSAWDFGQLILDEFTIDGERFRATGGGGVGGRRHRQVAGDGEHEQ